MWSVGVSIMLIFLVLGNVYGAGEVLYKSRERWSMD